MGGHPTPTIEHGGQPASADVTTLTTTGVVSTAQLWVAVSSNVTEVEALCPGLVPTPHT